jgi:hypothetical protein
LRLLRSNVRAVEWGLELTASGGDFGEGRARFDANIVDGGSTPGHHEKALSRVLAAEGARGSPTSAMRCRCFSRFSS